MIKKYIAITLLFFILLNTLITQVAHSADGNAGYLKSYIANYPAYLKNDKVIADAFLANYNGSEAKAIVARAIWYMENGYTVYGHTKYPETGFIDCSNYISLVFKDFGYKITSVSANYNKVGTKIQGVYSQLIPGSSKYELIGADKLRPGDILTFWKKNSTGDGTHIGHVALYMGKINGKPTIIQTDDNKPTAIGIKNDFSTWSGEYFQDARRVLDDDSQYPGKYWRASAPTIPAIYQITPQYEIVMPNSKFIGYGVKDISGHWAESSIKEFLKNEYISGYSDGTFKPDQDVTRAEFIAIIVKAFKFNLVKGDTFKDTGGHWASDYINTALEHGIIKGYSNTIFGPDDLLTREQMAAIICKAAGIDISTPPSLDGVFSDSDQIFDWAKNSVAAAYTQGLVKGFPDGVFNPQAYTTRAEAVTVIQKAI